MLDTKAPKKYAKLKHQDLIFVYESVKAYITKDGDYCVYDEGFDDNRIADIVMNHPGYEYINGSHVERIRRLYFGNLKPKAPDPKSKSSRISLIESHLVVLGSDVEAMLKFLTARGFKVEDWRNHD